MTTYYIYLTVWELYARGIDMLLHTAFKFGCDSISRQQKKESFSAYRFQIEKQTKILAVSDKNNSRNWKESWPLDIEIFSTAFNWSGNQWKTVKVSPACVYWIYTMTATLLD